MLTNVAVAVLPHVAPFELGTICEVFGIDRTEMGVPAFDFAICAERPGEPLPTKAGFSITAPHGFDRLAEADLVAVPASGGRDYPEALLQALRDAVDRGAWVLSVCSGARCSPPPASWTAAVARRTGCTPPTSPPATRW